MSETFSGIQRPGLRTRSEQLQAWVEYKRPMWQKEGETLISCFLHTQEEEQTLRHRCKVSEQGRNCACKLLRSMWDKQKLSTENRKSLSNVTVSSFKSRSTEIQELALNLKKVTERCKKEYTEPVIATWHVSKCARSFLVEPRTARVLQQGEHANTCGLVVCHAKLIWLAGLNPGAKSNSALQSPEWGSRWGSQDDLPSYLNIPLGVKAWMRHFLQTVNKAALLSCCFHFGCHWWLFSVLFQIEPSVTSGLFTLHGNEYEFHLSNENNETFWPVGAYCSLAGFAASLHEWAIFDFLWFDLFVLPS